MVGKHVLTPMLDRHPHDSEKIAMVHATQTIGMDESPKTPSAIKKMPPFWWPRAW